MSDTAWEILSSISLGQLISIILFIFFIIYIIKKSNILNGLEWYRKYKNKKDKMFKDIENNSKQIKELQEENAMLHEEVNSIGGQLDEILKSLKHMQETNEQVNRDKLRDRITQSYRYYKEQETKEWTEIEAETFWALIDSYDLMKGNGFVKNTVIPFMQEFEIK